MLGLGAKRTGEERKSPPPLAAGDPFGFGRKRSKGSSFAGSIKNFLSVGNEDATTPSWHFIVKNCTFTRFSCQ